MNDRCVSPDPGSGNESGSGSEQQDDPQSPDDTAGLGLIKAEHISGNAVDTNQSFSMPVQKRRRVTRACDECRRKKIKCDGKQPCTHCSVYSYECTYDKPSNRRRNPAPQYIEALESKLARAEVLLRKFIPDVDLNDPNLDPSVQKEFQTRERARLQASTVKREEEQKTEHNDAQIMSMIETIGQLDLTEGGGWDFRGTSSGAVFLRRMKEHFGGLLGYDYQSTFLPRPSKIPGLLKLDSPQPSTGVSSPADPTISKLHQLPPQERARQLSYCALTCATALLRIVHVPSFFERFEEIYLKSADDFDLEDNRFIALIYAVMAVGSMYNTVEEDVDNQVHYSKAAEEGMEYYLSARALLQDITECRDLTSLQALLFLILFLQATTNLSACYSFLGIALRSAVRMGLHRHLPHANFTALDTELRRRIFYFIRQLDIYCSALLGFPILLHDEDIDQKLPTEVDDEFITAEGIQKPPPGTPGSFIQAFNAHSRLMKILLKIVRHIYPLKGTEECGTSTSGPSNATYMIDYRRIKEIENELQVWHEQLPPRWRPSAEGPMEVLRVRTLLRFAYAHVQMMLYRQFLHYISPRLSGRTAVDDRYYACAAAGISVSRNIIHIATEIKNHALIVGPFWSMLYTQFFAILTLVFYSLENPEKQGSADIFADANAGRDVILKMAPRSFAADRITHSLSTLWGNLPESVKSGKTRSIPSKKRSAPEPKSESVPPGTHKSHVASTNIASAASQSMSHRTPRESRNISTSQKFASLNYSEPHALDVSSSLAPLDLNVATSTSHASSQYVQHGSIAQARESMSDLYKLDAMMFSSSDPFAYPNQPLLDYGGSTTATSETQPSHMAIVQANPTDSRNFYMSGLYGELEGQLMTSLPQYLMQPSGGQNGMDISAQMYQPSSSLPLQQAQARQMAHSYFSDHNMGRDVDDMMVDSGFNGSWDMFGNSFKPL